MKWLVPAVFLLALAAPTKAENAPKFKLFRVYYAATDGREIKIFGLNVPVFETRAECDIWRRLDVQIRADKQEPYLPYQGEPYLILGSYCSGGMDV